jgi:iron complex transport system substrate-binding protein
MKTISLVPSWTETLIEVGLDVVGRTRYCIHPDHAVNAIPSVGGTKTPDIEKIKQINPDLIVLDREENAKQTAEALAGFNTHVSHVTSMANLPEEIVQLAQACRSKTQAYKMLIEMSERWKLLNENSPGVTAIDEIPGVVTWIKKPSALPAKLVYLIWHDPWMSVSKQTFIGSILEWLNFDLEVFDSESAYPIVNAATLDDPATLILASSEPFPFENKPQLFANLQASAAIVDGEVYSWFGHRSLRALEQWREETFESL